MTLHPQDETLHRLVDGELEAAELAAVEAHLAACRDCAGFVQRLYRLDRLAHRAPEGYPPPADLWPGVLEEASRMGLVKGGRGAPRVRGLAITGVAAASLVGLLLVRPGKAPRSAGEDSRWMASGTPSSGAVRIALSDSADGSAVLAAEFEARKAFLQPETIATVERNLAIIDRAIQDTRLALEGDPGNAHLREMLQRSERRKVQYLETAISLASL